MKDLKKKVLATFMAVVLVCSLPMVAGAVSGTFTTYGGPYCKTWNYSVTMREVASAFYRVTGRITQPDIYKYNYVEVEVTAFRHGETNAFSEVTAEDAYTLETYADASKGVSNGTGSMYCYVNDNLYGQYSDTYFLDYTESLE